MDLPQAGVPIIFEIEQTLADVLHLLLQGVEIFGGVLQIDYESFAFLLSLVQFVLKSLNRIKSFLSQLLTLLLFVLQQF
jgi:hypothetical protein